MTDSRFKPYDPEKPLLLVPDLRTGVVQRFLKYGGVYRERLVGPASVPVIIIAGRPYRETSEEYDTVFMQ